MFNFQKLRYFVLLCVALFYLPSYAQSSLQVAKPLPNIVGKNLNINNIFRSKNLGDNYKLLLIFTASGDCCQQSIEDIARIEQNIKELEIYAIHSGESRYSGVISIRDVRDYTNRLPIAPSNIIWSSATLHQKLGFEDFPALILVGPDNRVIDYVEGEQSIDTIFYTDSLNTLLATAEWNGWDFATPTNNQSIQPTVQNSEPTKPIKRNTNNDPQQQKNTPVVKKSTKKLKDLLGDIIE